MKKIEELTQEQQDQFKVYIDKWTKIGLSTNRANRANAENQCKEAYKVAGLSEPKLILWAKSPIGLLLTAKLIKEIASKLTKDDILNEKNADIRRELIRKFGMAKIVKLLKPKVLDKTPDYKLLAIDLNDGRTPRPFLQMLNPSINTVHIEGVPLECKTVQDAIKFRNGLDDFNGKVQWKIT